MLDKNSKTVTKWAQRNKKHFESKGYNYTKLGDAFEVNVKDLNPGSRCEVTILCDNCGEIAFNKEYKVYMNSRKNHPNAKDICDECKINNPSLCSSNAKVPFKLIQNTFEKMGLKLLTTEKEYINTSTKLIFVCNKHIEFEEQSTKWNSLKHSKFGCKKCGRESLDNFMRYEYDYSQRKLPWEHNIEIAKEEFKKRGFLLLEEKFKYKHTNMDYICLKHEDKGIQKTSLRTVMNKEKFPNVCKFCSIEAQSGENSHFWKGGVTEKNKILRESYEGTLWRESVFIRDNYTCQCCGDDKGGNLQAHHIENFRDNKDKRFDIENGITLCKSCHDPSFEGSFHHIYGTIDNTKEQLEEYLNNKKKNIKNNIKPTRKGARSFFTDNQVLDIRSKLNNKIKPKEIAEQYKVNISVIYGIKIGRNYKRVKGD